MVIIRMASPCYFCPAIPSVLKFRHGFGLYGLRNEKKEKL
tara:strand:+ start:206 stop:325 length:120 start_codon:yes stop_codon:yes gene_type:complete